jgi:YggT family protein
MVSLLQILYVLLDFYMWVLIISAVLSWLLMFNVVNAASPFVRQLDAMLRALTEPALRPLRRILPVVNGLDLSSLALFFGLMFARMVIRNNIPLFY